jgi:hypothetical protein
MAGQYFSPSAIEQHGKKLNFTGEGQPPTVESVGGLTLVAVVDNGSYRIAGNVSNPIGMNAHLEQLRSGRYKTFHLYAVADDKLELCADKGREPSTYGRGGKIELG